MQIGALIDQIDDINPTLEVSVRLTPSKDTPCVMELEWVILNDDGSIYKKLDG